MKVREGKYFILFLFSSYHCCPKWIIEFFWLWLWDHIIYSGLWKLAGILEDLLRMSLLGIMEVIRW